MLVSVTPLGVRHGQPARAAAQVVNYVESKVQAGRRLQSASVEGVERYYADSVEGPGRWVGGGSDALGLGGQVSAIHLERVLVGEHPGTGETLRPVTSRSGMDSDLSTRVDSAELLTLAEAAQLAGVTARALRYAAQAAPEDAAA